jgi:hypothetical protein
LSRDIRNGDARDVRSFYVKTSERTGETGYSIENHSNSVARYVEESGSMDASDLPQDFQIAWEKHMDAWRDYSEYLDDLKNSSDTKLSYKDLHIAENPYNREINRTWFEVLRIGETYGAYIE